MLTGRRLRGFLLLRVRCIVGLLPCFVVILTIFVRGMLLAVRLAVARRCSIGLLLRLRRFLPRIPLGRLTVGRPRRILLACLRGFIARSMALQSRLLVGCRALPVQSRHRRGRRVAGLRVNLVLWLLTCLFKRWVGLMLGLRRLVSIRLMWLLVRRGMDLFCLLMV